MPIREYHCKCSKEFERLVGMHEEVECPHCKSEVKPLMSKTSFILKGGGWACGGYSKKE